MYRILSVSRNVSLLLQRNDALAIAGFRVFSPKRPEDAPLLLEQQSADAVVIGHSVLATQRRALIRAIRKRRPNVPIFFVYAAPEKMGEPLADLSLDVTSGPQTLVQAIQQRLVGRQAA